MIDIVRRTGVKSTLLVISLWRFFVYCSRFLHLPWHALIVPHWEKSSCSKPSTGALNKRRSMIITYANTYSTWCLSCSRAFFVFISRQFFLDFVFDSRVFGRPASKEKENKYIEGLELLGWLNGSPQTCQVVMQSIHTGACFVTLLVYYYIMYCLSGRVLTEKTKKKVSEWGEKWARTTIAK